MTAITGPGQMQGPLGKSGSKVPKGYKQFQLQQFTPEQMEMFKGLLPYLGNESWLAKLAGGDEGEFEKIEAPLKREYGEMLGGLSSKFSGMGMGGQKSSGFQNTMTSAASNFAQELGAKRHGLKSQALKDLFEMSNMMMGQRPYETGLVEKGPSTMDKWMQLVGNLSGEAMNAAAKSFSGGAA